MIFLKKNLGFLTPAITKETQQMVEGDHSAEGARIISFQLWTSGVKGSYWFMIHNAM